MPEIFFWNEVVIPLAGMATGLFITLSVIKAITRHLERRHELRLGGGGGDSEGLRGEVQRLRAQVESLEERVDFAERMLTQQRERPGLPPRS